MVLTNSPIKILGKSGFMSYRSDIQKNTQTPKQRLLFDIHRSSNHFFIFYHNPCTQRRIQGGLWGLSPPGPVNSFDFMGFSGPNGFRAPPGERKKFKPPLAKFLNTPLLVQKCLDVQQEDS